MAHLENVYQKYECLEWTQKLSQDSVSVKIVLCALLATQNDSHRKLRSCCGLVKSVDPLACFSPH